jgi:hypothetical protein
MNDRIFAPIVLKAAYLTQALPNGSYAYQPAQHSLSKDGAPRK